MAEEAYAVVAVVMTCALLLAVLVPAPARAPDNEAELTGTLLLAGCIMTLVSGALALGGSTPESAVCGATAWVLVTPCLWLARAARPASDGGWELEDDDDGGGTPPPYGPSAPPSRDDRRAEQPTAMPGARVAWAMPAAAPAPATAHAPAAASLPEPAFDGWGTTRMRGIGVTPPAPAPLQPVIAVPAWHLLTRPPGVQSWFVAPESVVEPEAPAAPQPAGDEQHRRVPTAPARPRGEHRSIAHVHAAAPEGRRRRANMRWLVLRRPRFLRSAAPR